MTKPDDEYALIDSPLSGPMRRDGVEIEVCVYHGEEEPEWVLEAADPEGNSFVWDDKFETDQAAMDKLLRTIRFEGMKQCNPY